MSLIAQTPAQGLFLAVTALNSKVRDVMVRAFLMGCSDADATEWRKLVEAEKKRRQRAVVPLTANDSSGQCPDSAEEAIGTMSPLCENGQRDKTPPPPTPLSSPPPPQPPAHVRPTVPDVLRFFDSSASCTILPAKRAEVAQAYIDSRDRLDPPWTIPATFDRPAKLVGENWQADCRQFCRRWRDVEQEKATREQQRASAGIGGTNRARAGPDTTPLPVDPARWTAFLEHPDHAHFHRLKTEPPPKTETDIPRGAVEDFKNFKRRK